jgi:hypothetical protein
MHASVPALLVVAALLALPSTSAADPVVLKDLSAVIALQGLPCGEVTQADRKGDNDYVATCKDGSRYRVHTKDGRVVVVKA